MTCNLHRSIAADMGRAAFDENKGRDVPWINRKLLQQFSPSGRLGRGKPNYAVPLMGKYKSNRTGAQVAHRIKYDDVSRVDRHFSSVCSQGLVTTAAMPHSRKPK